MEDWLKYLIAFILGWIIARMMGEGFSVGGVDCSNLSLADDSRGCQSLSEKECPNYYQDLYGERYSCKANMASGNCYNHQLCDSQFD